MLNDTWTILELVAVGPADGAKGELGSLLTGGATNWGELIETAARHKLLALLGDELGRKGLFKHAPRFVARLLSDTLALNRYRVATFARSARAIAEALEGAGIRVAVTKGVPLDVQAYGARGARTMCDVDLMIQPQDGRRTAAALGELGYRQGYFDCREREIHEFTRAELARYYLQPDHLPPMVKLLDDPIVESLEVDIACSLTWTRCAYTVPMTEALANVSRVMLPQGGSIPTLDREHQLLFTVLHLFREAWIDTWISLEQDVSLSKFADVLRLLRLCADTRERERFGDLVRRYGVEEPVAWVLTHLDRVFATGTVEETGLGGCVREELLGMRAGADGRLTPWRGTMRERLQSRDRREFVGV
jgi:hypothetical protein